MEPPLRLTHPVPSLRDSYRALVAEFVAGGEKLVPFTLSFAHDDFDAMIERLTQCSRGIGIAEGFVAHSAFWLTRGTEVVGVSDLRHALTPALRREGGNIGYGIKPSARRQGLACELLRMTLVRARDLGIEQALVTCGKANIASAKVILRNGGIFESEEYLPERDELVQRYWLPVPSAPPAAQSGA